MAIFGINSLDFWGLNPTNPTYQTNKPNPTQPNLPNKPTNQPTNQPTQQTNPRIIQSAQETAQRHRLVVVVPRWPKPPSSSDAQHLMAEVMIGEFTGDPPCGFRGLVC